MPPDVVSVRSGSYIRDGEVTNHVYISHTQATRFFPACLKIYMHAMADAFVMRHWGGCRCDQWTGRGLGGKRNRSFVLCQQAE